MAPSKIDENPTGEDERAELDATRYARIVAVVVGAAALAAAGVLIYRRMRRPARREQLRRMLVDALEDLPEILRDLPDEIKSAVPEAGAKARGAFESMIRRVRD
jgi:hypothetical protein